VASHNAIGPWKPVWSNNGGIKQENAIDVVARVLGNL
jgi:hypothetical protein